MHKASRGAVGLLVLSLLVSGCYGPFNLTKRLYRWNGQIGTKWEREFMFIVLAWAPVYSIAVLADAVVFNSMEFWTGNNPVDPPRAEQSPVQTKRLVRGDDEAVLTYQPLSSAQTLQIEQFRSGEPAGSLWIERQAEVSVGRDAQGQVLFTARTQPDGRVLVTDRNGKEVAAY
ncbi:MAG: DUF3332 family protein [Candidatus Omnitrophica bacterium]|nr:DUF3332 family protein [Candidatus Omnitrophota bacterium]